MRLYLDRIVDWERQLALANGDGAAVAADVAAYRGVLETGAQLAESFEPAGREHWATEASLTADGGAESPLHIRRAYDELRKAGLVSLSVSESYGGFGLPALVNGIYMEMLARADASLMMVLGLQVGAANDIEKYGSEEIKRAYLPRFASGEVQGCMDLTEPQAGSDLGGIVTRATDLPDGRIRVDGQKIFISNGGAEVHLVLARDADSFEQSKGTTNGLSLVLVARHREDGRANGVRVARLEHKIGIHGSATCEVVFENAIGVRLGEKGKGFRAMLDLMNHARLGVASQSLGLAQAAMHDAMMYAQQRVQFGRPILGQPLVTTMLAKMKVDVEAVRAVLYRTYQLLDMNAAREKALARGGLSQAEQLALKDELEQDRTRVKLLTPLCKYFSTEMCDDLTRDALQVMGGVGFTLDSNAGKLHADGLIMTIYEGTSEIQASFALREIGKGALGVLFDGIREDLARMASDPTRAGYAAQVTEMIERANEATRLLFSDLNYALMRSKLMLELVIDVIASIELLKQASYEPARIDLAIAWIQRRSLEGKLRLERIAAGASRYARDEKLVQLALAEG
jgi:alkylation response protein AidB-like acyl-CoA dehydrogenase